MRKIKLTKEQYSRVKSLLNESDNTKSDLKDETIKLLKKFYGKTNDFSSYWGKHGLTYDDICDNLLDKEILIKKNGNFELSKSLGNKEEAMKKLEKALNYIINKNNFEILYKNIDFAILKNEKNDLYLLNYGNIDTKYEDELLKEEGENESSNEFIGIRALDAYPFNQLPNTRQEVNWDKRGVEGWGVIYIPSVNFYTSLQIPSKDDLVIYINEFKYKHKQEPTFLINKDSKTIKIKGFDEYEKKQIDLFGAAAKQTMDYKNESESKNINLKKNNSESNILSYANKIADKDGEGLKDLKKGVELVKIDKELKDKLLNLYDKDIKLTSVLSGINEMDMSDIKSRLADPFKAQPKGYESKSDEERANILQKLADIKIKSQAQDDERFKNRDIQNAIDSARAEEKLKQQKPSQQQEPKKPIGQYNMFGGVDEISSTGSVGGQHTTALQFKPMRKDISIVTDVPVVRESLTATEDSIGQYTATAFKMKKNHTDFAEVKPKAFKKTQWAGGSFVEFDDCVKPNNNKEAQKGGCSTGAVDNVVKLKKTKGNVNAPSLNEGMMREALKLQRDTKENKLIVVSDLEGRAASQETFTNKAVLKQNGFVWTGTNWAIPADKLDVAKKTLSLINKAEYLIDKLEDLETAVEESGADNKSLLKARLDQYISDLANATNEAALSAEIQRYLTFFSKFHSYSFYNRILIYIQRPDATRVASYKTWQSKFRQVNKGAKGITVLAPIMSKSAKPDGQDDDNLSTSSDVRGFRAVNVFDISDTSPIDERGEVPQEPQWWNDNTPSETADKLFNAVSEVATDMGIKITQSDASGGEKGFSAGDHINISSDVTGAGRLSTMIHEIAHELMHWKKSSIYYIDNGEGKEKRELQELQAESVSYVVLKHYGIPVSHHATYLALWKANKERIQSNLEIISKVSQFIISKIDAQITEDK